MGGGAGTASPARAPLDSRKGFYLRPPWEGRGELVLDFTASPSRAYWQVARVGIPTVLLTEQLEIA